MIRKLTSAAGLSLSTGSYDSPITRIVELDIEGALCGTASMDDVDNEEWGEEEDLW